MRGGTRVLLLAAGALTAGSLLVPLWGFRMSAPQYPDEALHVQVTRAGLQGDLREIGTLQEYVGVRFPTVLPELPFVRAAVLGLAVLFIVGATASGRAGTAIQVGTVVLMLGFFLASLVALQVRLYRVGHERDPRAPLTAVKDFTPPALGPVTVGNFTVWSYPHLGGAALAVAAALGAAAARRTVRGRKASSRQVGVSGRPREAMS